MNEEIMEIAELLSDLLEDVPSKVRTEIEVAIKMLGVQEIDQEGLIKVQEQLELVSNMNNIDSYSRSEILNIISDLENML